MVNTSPFAPENLEVCTRKCYKVLEKCCRSTLQKYYRSTAEVLQRITKVLQSTWEVSRITKKFSDLFLGKHTQCYKVLEKCCRSTLQKYCRSITQDYKGVTEYLGSKCNYKKVQ